MKIGIITGEREGAVMLARNLHDMSVCDSIPFATIQIQHSTSIAFFSTNCVKNRSTRMHKNRYHYRWTQECGTSMNSITEDVTQLQSDKYCLVFYTFSWHRNWCGPLIEQMAEDILGYRRNCEVCELATPRYLSNIPEQILKRDLLYGISMRIWLLDGSSSPYSKCRSRFRDDCKVWLYVTRHRV